MVNATHQKFLDQIQDIPERYKSNINDLKHKGYTYLDYNGVVVLTTNMEQVRAEEYNITKLNGKYIIYLSPHMVQVKNINMENLKKVYGSYQVRKNAFERGTIKLGNVMKLTKLGYNVFSWE